MVTLETPSAVLCRKGPTVQVIKLHFQPRTASKIDELTLTHWLAATTAFDLYKTTTTKQYTSLVDSRTFSCAFSGNWNFWTDFVMGSYLQPRLYWSNSLEPPLVGCICTVCLVRKWGGRQVAEVQLWHHLTFLWYWLSFLHLSCSLAAKPSLFASLSRSLSPIMITVCLQRLDCPNLEPVLTAGHRFSCFSSHQLAERISES